jgi:hypothetical protein
MTNREAGINVVREMMGDQAAAKPSASADSHTFGAPIAAYAVDQAFADIWTRPGLDRRSRSLLDSRTSHVAGLFIKKSHSARSKQLKSPYSPSNERFSCSQS